MFTHKNSRLCILSTKVKERVEKRSKLENCGNISLIVRLRLELLICCTRMLVTKNPISKIWEP